jgi:hypothetical protein
MKAPTIWRKLFAAAIGWIALCTGVRAEFLFSEIVFYEVGEGSGPFAKGDFDGARRPGGREYRFGTVALTGTMDTALWVLFALSVGSSVVAVAAGDLDNDGDLDLAFADEGLFIKSVGALLNNGQGSFAAGGKTTLFDANIDSRLHPRGMVLGDFNGDGFPDAAVACEGSEVVNRGFVAVAMNAGNGSFAEAGRLSVAPRPLGPKMLAAGTSPGGSTDLIVGTGPLLALFEYGAAESTRPSVMEVPQAPTSLRGFGW